MIIKSVFPARIAFYEEKTLLGLNTALSKKELFSGLGSFSLSLKALQSSRGLKTSRLKKRLFSFY
jgi:hypothetical protein